MDSQNDKINEERWLTYKDVTRLTSFSRWSIGRWVDAGIFPPPFKVGKHLLWKESVVREWMEKQEATARPRPQTS